MSHLREKREGIEIRITDNDYEARIMITINQIDE